jgi:hypothetical protein
VITGISLAEARPGDVLVFQLSGWFPSLLAWLIWKIKAPGWDRDDWHLAPVVIATPLDLVYIDAQMPSVKLNTLSRAASGVRAYRIMEEEPTQAQCQDIIADLVGKPYDILIYGLTAIRQLGLKIPRIINQSYDCWEVTWEAADQWGHPISDSWEYPFITDFLRLAGEC